MFSLFFLHKLIVISQIIAVNAESSNNCSCPTPPTIQWAKTPVVDQCITSFRYSCVAGRVRKAGTSNLIKCKENENGLQTWTNSTLHCIPDPKNPQPIKTSTEANPPTISVTSWIDDKSTIEPEEIQQITSMTTIQGLKSPEGDVNTKHNVQEDIVPEKGESLPTNTPPTSTKMQPVVRTYSNESSKEPVSGILGPVGLSAVVVPLVLIVGLIIGFICFKKRGSRNAGPLCTGEEVMPMTQCNARIKAVETSSLSPEGT